MPTITSPTGTKKNSSLGQNGRSSGKSIPRQERLCPPERIGESRRQSQAPLPRSAAPYQLPVFCAVFTAQPTCSIKSARKLALKRISRRVSRTATRRFCLSPTISSWKKTTRSAAFLTGSACIFIPVEHAECFTDLALAFSKAEYSSRGG